MKKKISYIGVLITLFVLKTSPVYGYNNYEKGKLHCGDKMINNIPEMVPKTVNIVYLTIQIAVPVLLVIFGSIDLIKAVSSGKEDDIKQAQRTLIHRLILGVLVFFIFVIVKALVYAFGNHTGKVLNCFNCFINYECGGK